MAKLDFVTFAWQGPGRPRKNPLPELDRSELPELVKPLSPHTHPLTSPYHQQRKNQEVIWPRHKDMLMVKLNKKKVIWPRHIHMLMVKLNKKKMIKASARLLSIRCIHFQVKIIFERESSMLSYYHLSPADTSVCSLFPLPPNAD